MFDRLKKRMMLISNSFCFGKGYLEHCASAIQEFLGPINQIAFVPYALKDWDKYTSIAREGFAKMGISVIGVHEVEGSQDWEVLQKAKAVFVGGGNTFRLLNQLYKHELVDSDVWERIYSGELAYLGASAGANVACPTIMTTNDMPIVQPSEFRALNLFPWQINPHFVDANPASKHMGETREKRIAEFLEENGTFVIGLREGSWVIVENGVARLQGATGAMLFEKGLEPTEWDPQQSIFVS